MLKPLAQAHRDDGAATRRCDADLARAVACEAGLAEQFELPGLHVLGLVPGDDERGHEVSMFFVALFGRMLGVAVVSPESLGVDRSPVVIVDHVGKECAVVSLTTFMDGRARIEEALRVRSVKDVAVPPAP